jgi:heptosyltransferase III
MQNAAVLPALGIGDALLMMIASHQLKMEGYNVTTYHDSLPGLLPWFPGHDIQSLPPNDLLIEVLTPYDLVIVENDNSPKIRGMIEELRPQLSIFYPTYLSTKHAPLASSDRDFDRDLPMAENIANAIASLIDLPAASKDNGLSPPSHLAFRSKKDQVLIHPTSRLPEKNWKAEGFMNVAFELKIKGMTPIFCVSPAERAEWEFVERQGFSLASPPTLAALAELVYESGYVIGNDSLIGHLASNLGVPTLIIAGDEKRMRLWRPGWHQGQLVLPPPYLPNWKFLRLRENHWQNFITPEKVLRNFDKLVSTL